MSYGGSSVSAETNTIERGILHLIGRDQIGILQEASAFITERGGTIEEGISHTLSTEAAFLAFAISAATISFASASETICRTI